MNEFAMHDAAENNDLEWVRQLIRMGVTVDRLIEVGQIPLQLAARYGQYEVAALLINSKCNINLKHYYGYTPVMLAARLGRKDMVELLLHHGAQVNCVGDDGWTLLHHVSFNGWVGIVLLILDNGGADLNAADKDGNTPLMQAAMMGHREVTAALIQAGADVNRSDVQKFTALHVAVVFGSTRVMPILLFKEGLDLSPQDVYGNTPLHLACLCISPALRTNLEPIKQLLGAGADTDVQNNQGKTALNIGISIGNLIHEDIRLFVEKGAFLENCDYECILRKPFLKETVLKDAELCTQSVVNKFNRQSLSALSDIAYFARRLPNVDNFKLNTRHIDEVRNLVKCEIERNTFCNVVKVRPIALSALCVQSLITCQSGRK